MSRLVGHYAPWLLVAVVAVLIVMTLAPPLAPLASWLILVVLLAVALVLAGSLFAHNRGLCERCISSVPLDASRVASRYGARFRIAHLFERKLFAVAYLVIVVGTSFLYFHPIGRYAWATAQASLAYLLVVYITHQRLQPWCPYCKSGGEEETTPSTPTPVSSAL